MPLLTLGCCSLLPASRVGGCQAGWALLVLRRLHHGRHNHLLPCCGWVCRAAVIFILKRWVWNKWLIVVPIVKKDIVSKIHVEQCEYTDTEQQSHLPLSEIAALLSFSEERLPAQSNEHALCPELPSCRCTAEALAGSEAQGKPGLDLAPELGPEQPWQPTGPPDDAQTDPETHTSKRTKKKKTHITQGQKWKATLNLFFY